MSYDRFIVISQDFCISSRTLFDGEHDLNEKLQICQKKDTRPASQGRSQVIKFDYLFSVLVWLGFSLLYSYEANYVRLLLDVVKYSQESFTEFLDFKNCHNLLGIF